MITLRYDETLDAGSVPATTDFAVTVNGTPDAVTSVAVNTTNVTLALTSAPTTGDTVLVSYTPGANPIQDVTGNDAAALVNQAVTETPSSPFGGLLPARLLTSGGATHNVASLAALTTQLGLAANGDIINITANLVGTAQIYTISRNASAAAPITITCDPGVTITNFGQWDVRGSYLRFKDLDIGYATIDGIKIDVAAHHIEVDGCIIHHAVRQGINIQPSPTDIQIWNNIVHTNGSVGHLDHGIYFGYARGGCVIANNLWYDNWAFNVQLYPNCQGLIFTCNTVDDGQVHGSDGRGGLVIGSETGTTDNNILVGNLYTNAPQHGIEIYNPSGGDSGNVAYDSLAFGNGASDYQTNASITYTNCSHADPLYVNAGSRNYHLQGGSPAIGKIQAARYGYVPPLDIEGTTRLTADAGAYAA